MRTISRFLPALLLTALSCNEFGRDDASRANHESNKAAKEENERKFGGERQADAAFVYETVGASYGNIKMAELATQRSRNEGLKQLVERLQKEHTNLLNDLKMLAQSRSIALPVQETETAKNTIEKIASESGDEFVKKWCGHMMESHDNSIKRFEDRLDKTKDPRLKDFIESKLPLLKDHYRQIRSLSQELEGAG